MKPALTLIDDDNARAARALEDPEEFGLLYEAYFPRVYNYIRYRIIDPATTDDLTSSTFHKALDKLSTFDPSRAAFPAWLFAIARNTINDHLRALRRRRWVSLFWAGERASDRPDPELEMIQDEDRRRLLAAVAELPERERDILGLKFGARHTNRAIAELTGLGESNVGVIIHRALGRLRSRLLAEEENHD
jgi:RNA polymerase sigma factor (sigma-70 family)